MDTVTIKIYEGSHYTDAIAKKYYATGLIDHLIEGAKVKCGQLKSTKGKRVWVDFDKDGFTITHRIFQEG